MSFVDAPRLPRSPKLGWLLLGGVLIASFDALFATMFWKLGYDVPPQRIFQSIAAGVLGAKSFEGGAQSAWLGAALHYFIALAMVFAYAWVARGWRALIEHPWRYGLLYGAWLYILMNFIVVPLSAANTPKFNATWVGASIIVHLIIGLACAAFSRRALR